MMAAACAPQLSENISRALDEYARAIGLAFQIQDDLLDVEGDVAVIGKATGADKALDKPTYPSVAGIEAFRLGQAATVLSSAGTELATFAVEGRPEIAFEEIPQEAIEEFLADAPEDVRQNVLRRVEVAEKHEREATAVLAESARGAGVRPAEVEEIGRLMKLGRIQFVNTELPFRDAILLTVSGKLEQAIGYLYTPHGELPWINPEEYFYLEELGDGWWIFRSA